LSDLFEYYDATQTFVNRLINVRKTESAYMMISKIEEFMRTKYKFLSIDRIQATIDELRDQDEDDLMSMFLEAEREEGASLTRAAGSDNRRRP
jgi:hypothetical protein